MKPLSVGKSSILLRLEGVWWLAITLFKMELLSQFFNRINFKLFFYFIIPLSLISIGIYKNFILTSKLSLSESIRLTSSELISPYFSAAIWIFLYSVVRGNFMDQRTKRINQNLLDLFFYHDKRYMNLQNYQIFVFVAWLIALITKFI